MRSKKINFNKLAVSLEDYIKRYIPDGWQAPLSNVMYCPIITEDIIKKLVRDYKKGELVKKFNDYYPNHTSPFFVIATQEFLDYTFKKK